MNRPKIILRKNKVEVIIEILTFAFIFISLIVIGVYYFQLPEKIPIHFNWPSKDQNGLGSKDILFSSPIIFGFIAVGIYKLNQHPWIFNYPLEINEKNAAYHYRQATQILRILNLIIGIMCLSLTSMSVLNGLGIETKLVNHIGLLFPILFIGLPVMFVMKMLMNNKTVE